MNTLAVVLAAPQQLTLSCMELAPPKEEEVVVDIEYSGISTGTERLLWSGRMPHFPGMGYPLVPGYESVGRITQAGSLARERIGEWVFVPGARCFGEVRGLFGGAASRVVVPAARVTSVDEALGAEGVLLALAATAAHALSAVDGSPPDLIVGHGVLGRLLARIAVARGAHPTVWERDPQRSNVDQPGYRVIHPDADDRRDYRAIYDASGDPSLLDALIARLGRAGQVVLAGFYERDLSFAFAPAFMREARIRVAAEWLPEDLEQVKAMVSAGQLSLHGLITHRHAAHTAPGAYHQAFHDPGCLKMILDWRDSA